METQTNEQIEETNLSPECLASNSDAELTDNKASGESAPAVATGAGIAEIVDQGKMNDFIEYVESIDRQTSENDKLDFRQFDETSKRMRYPSFTCGGEEQTDELLAELPEAAAESDSVAQYKAEIDRMNLMLNPYQRRPQLKRKTNMFASDSAYFINHERAVEFQAADTSPASKSPKSLSPSPRSPAELSPTELSPSPTRQGVLQKSRTVDRSLSTGDFVFTVQDEDEDGSVRLIDSSSLETLEMRRESLDSEQSLESNYFVRSSESGSVYTREDSWMSGDSNAFNRSQSTYSELEYITGRDDWKERQSSIREQIDSDNYHHNRRFSENSEALEYIRGREDWLRNEMKHARSNTLPQLFEHGNRKFLIQDEIDSDEYHHNFYLSEAIRTATELDPRVVVHGAASSGRSRSPYRVLHADIDKEEFLQRYYWKGEDGEESAAHKRPPLPLRPVDHAEEKMMRDERLIWIESKKREKNLSKSAELQTLCDSDNDDQAEAAEITEVLDNIIDAKILTKESLEKSPSEDIEIMVLDLADTSEREKQEPNRASEEEEKHANQEKPFIIISEATDDEEEEAASDEEAADDVSEASDAFVYVELPSEENEMKLASESEAEADASANDKQIANEQRQESEQDGNERNSVNDGIEQEAASANHQSEKVIRTQFPVARDNFDDLIRDGSLGLWFHK